MQRWHTEMWASFYSHIDEEDLWNCWKKSLTLKYNDNNDVQTPHAAHILLEIKS